MEHADETSKHGDPEKLPTGGALPTSGEVVRPFTTCKRYVGFSHSSKSCCELPASDGFQSRMRFAVKDFVLLDLLSVASPTFPGHSKHDFWASTAVKCLCSSCHCSHDFLGYYNNKGSKQGLFVCCRCERLPSGLSTTFRAEHRNLSALRG